MSRVVITHPQMGIFLGNCIGLGFWSLKDTIGQNEAVTFEDKSDAIDHIRSWDENSDPACYAFVPVEAGDYASIAQLAAAGLTHMLGDMAANVEAHAT